ncbi:carbohydrate binding domain-containing protein [Flavobacteriaceae bacterium XHP0103]|uniref:alpha-L-arabinofuranosidase C-terminal domain-containing protein n=1 Tax=Marixanthotalea marina TaxID=2844359 RepID=UPI002989B6DA|nr:alpha-L-arabinofuranosidase C-terminal domain-containing protein [Marixanthotalea marina]MBU3821419.1 carbohydrate binding domain-containing protein [Marixanthotalea marina]
MNFRLLLLLCLLTSFYSNLNAQEGKKISPYLFGLFFEDINYAADGGLYAEMVQNRSFEYSPSDTPEWHPLTSWSYVTQVFSYGKLDIETNNPINTNNPHYAVLNIEHIGTRATGPESDIPQNKGTPGVGIQNTGYDGMVVKAGETYNFTIFAKQLSNNPISIHVSLQDSNGKILGENNIEVNTKDWKKYTTTLTPSVNSDSSSLMLLATSKGKLAIDVVSLFPQNTFKNRKNGLRADLAQLLADMKPSFVRFPGGCLTHGEGVGNMYRWKNTVGPIEQRIEQKNLWGYHQTGGLGYFEYFQFCEDIGAIPLPVLPAAVSCQNSGGTWRVGGTGQQALPMEDMQDYIQDVLDLVEWANGPINSKWGSIRANAGHPEPFNLEFIGIGNEDKMTPEFEERFNMIVSAVKAKYPEISLIGTSGPFSDGEDFEKGWEIADVNNIPLVDEHYYKQPEWFLSNLDRYDSYDRKKPGVYLGEYASWGNKLKNAIAEAAYMTTLERNADIVKMASYAPLLAKKDHTQWTTDMIFFDNKTYCLTPNYHVQKMFSTNYGDIYYKNIIATGKDTTLSASCLKDSKTGDIILKMVNTSTEFKQMKVNLNKFKNLPLDAKQIVLTGNAEAENTLENPDTIKPIESKIEIGKSFTYQAPPTSLTVIRIKQKP